jgi:hypothetical protein
VWRVYCLMKSLGVRVGGSGWGSKDGVRVGGLELGIKGWGFGVGGLRLGFRVLRLRVRVRVWLRFERFSCLGGGLGFRSGRRFRV